jgi:tetratricopeptide (TPR) repeat protein
LDPNVAGAHYQSGLVRLQEGDPAAAESEFRAELTLNPQDVVAKFHVAYVLMQQQHRDDAIKLLTEVIQQKPDYPDAQYQLGKALLETGDARGAVGPLETAVHLDAAQDNALYQLSLAYRRLGRTAEAEAALKKYQNIKNKQRDEAIRAHEGQQ